MKIYLSSRFGRAAELREYREELTAMGHTVEASWLDEPVGNDGITDPAQLVQFAEIDLYQLRQCDAFITFTEESTSPFGRGGRHVEFGAMLERAHWIKSVLHETPFIFVVGPCENVFHSLPCVQRFETWPEFVEYFMVVR